MTLKSKNTTGSPSNSNNLPPIVPKFEYVPIEVAEEISENELVQVQIIFLGDEEPIEVVTCAWEAELSINNFVRSGADSVFCFAGYFIPRVNIRFIKVNRCK